MFPSEDGNPNTGKFISIEEVVDRMLESVENSDEDGKTSWVTISKELVIDTFRIVMGDINNNKNIYDDRHDR